MLIRSVIAIVLFLSIFSSCSKDDDLAPIARDTWTISENTYLCRHTERDKQTLWGSKDSLVRITFSDGPAFDNSLDLYFKEAPKAGMVYKSFMSLRVRTRLELDFGKRVRAMAVAMIKDNTSM